VHIAALNDNGTERQKIGAITADYVLAHRTAATDTIGAEDNSCRLRPRTSTFPWDMLRSRNPAIVDDILRPRSSSGGYTTQLRDNLRARLAAARGSSMSSTLVASSTHSISPSAPRRSMIVCSADRLETLHSTSRPQYLLQPEFAQESDTSEYIEMHRPRADCYVEVALGPSADQ
jgi:hypothetical protein